MGESADIACEGLLGVSFLVSVTTAVGGGGREGGGTSHIKRTGVLVTPFRG